MVIMKSLTPIEYELVFTLAKLREKGKNSAMLTEIRDELNRRRKREKQKPTTLQAMYYHVQKLIKHPFVKKENAERNTHYSLVPGEWKLNQTPPLCISIGEDHLYLIICSEIKRCTESPMSSECLEKLKERGKIINP